MQWGVGLRPAATSHLGAPRLLPLHVPADLFQEHGAPLVLKRDNGPAFRRDALARCLSPGGMAVLAGHMQDGVGIRRALLKELDGLGGGAHHQLDAAPPRFGDHLVHDG